MRGFNEFQTPGNPRAGAALEMIFLSGAIRARLRPLSGRLGTIQKYYGKMLDLPRLAGLPDRVSQIERPNVKAHVDEAGLQGRRALAPAISLQARTDVRNRQDCEDAGNNRKHE